MARGFIAAIYYPNDDDEASRIRKELTTNLSRYASSVTVYELYKLTMESEDREIADLRVELLKRDFSITNLDWKIAKKPHLWKNITFQCGFNRRRNGSTA